MAYQISIIIPVLNEAERLADSLQALQALRGCCQLLVADGGSVDGSLDIAAPLVDQAITSPRGRAIQMNAAAQWAQADILLFLHADTRLPADAVAAVRQAVAAGHVWGRFDVIFDNAQPIFKLIAFMMNQRSRLTGIATGDQSLFMTRQAFETVGGFAPIALMEDIAISQCLKRLGKPACLRLKVMTSARRWQQHGVLKTILLMWRLRLAYFFGTDPDSLAAIYYKSNQ